MVLCTEFCNCASIVKLCLAIRADMQCDLHAERISLEWRPSSGLTPVLRHCFPKL